MFRERLEGRGFRANQGTGLGSTCRPEQATLLQTLENPRESTNEVMVGPAVQTSTIKKLNPKP